MTVNDVAPILAVRVHGVPRPQGSMRLFRAAGGHEVAKYSDKTYEWRRQVTAAVHEARAGLGLQRQSGEMYRGPVTLHLVFDLPRPRGHYGTGRNAESVRPSAPACPTVAPDLDKLTRLVGDAISDAGVVWADDAQVVEVQALKRFGREPGVAIWVYPYTEEVP